MLHNESDMSVPSTAEATNRDRIGPVDRIKISADIFDIQSQISVSKKYAPFSKISIHIFIPFLSLFLLQPDFLINQMLKTT